MEIFRKEVLSRLTREIFPGMVEGWEDRFGLRTLQRAACRGFGGTFLGVPPFRFFLQSANGFKRKDFFWMTALGFRLVQSYGLRKKAGRERNENHGTNGRPVSPRRDRNSTGGLVWDRDSGGVAMAQARARLNGMG